MNILFILENYFPHIGGVEIVFKTLCEGLVKQGHEVHVVTHRLAGTKKKERIGGVYIHRVACLENRYLFTFLSIPKALKLAKKADIIHTTTFNGAPPAWVVGKLARKKVVLTVHEVWIGKWGELTEMNPFSVFIHDMLERMLYLLSFDTYLCVSDSTKNQLKHIKKGKIITVHNGIDYDHFNPKNFVKEGKKLKKSLDLEQNHVIMCYGRPGVSKGIEYAILAMPEVLKTIPNAKLLLILSKDPAYKKRYQMMLDLIKKLKIPAIVLDPRPWKELPGYLMAADCVVVPSLAEGFGFSAAEACALGRPVVASDTTSLPEVVFGDYILSKVRDPRSISKGIIALKQGKGTKTKRKIFSWDENIKKTIQIYKKLAS